MHWIHERDKKRYARTVVMQMPTAKRMYIIKGGGVRARGFFDSIGNILKTNGSKLINVAIPSLFDLGGKLLDKVASSDGKAGTVAKTIKDNLGVVGKIAPAVLPLASSVLQNKLSDLGHDNLANTIGSTSQSLLQNILDRSKKGSGVKRLLDIKKPRKLKGGSSVFASYPAQT